MKILHTRGGVEVLVFDDEPEARHYFDLEAT